MNNLKPLNNEHGMVLVLTMLIMTALVLLGTTALMESQTELKIAANYKNSARVFYDSDAGINFAIGMMEIGLKANPPTFSLPTTVGGTSTLTYTIPSGFTFSISAITMLAANIYSFTSTSTGPNNSQAAITVTFTPAGGIFNYGIFSQNGVTLSGNGYTDSYDSSVGPWALATHHTNGDVGTNASGAGVIRLSGNARIYGNAQVGVGGDASTGITTSGNAAVLGQELVASSPKDMTPVADPGGGTAATLNLSSNDSQTISSGAYRLPSISLSGNATGNISGNVTLYVTGNISISGNATLNVLAGGSLTIYASGTVSISGNGITNNTLLPKNLIIYGTSTCSSVSISGNGNLYGAIYAPNANASITGNGNIYGSIVNSSMTDSGNGSIHYDEALQNVGTSSSLRLLSWRQL